VDREGGKGTQTSSDSLRPTAVQSTWGQFAAAHQFCWSCSWVSDQWSCCKSGAFVP